MTTRQSLDGLWEILPQYGPTTEIPATERELPSGDYDATPIRVPGYWNTFPSSVGGDWGAYDHYHYPARWQEAHSAWYRLRFTPRPSDTASGGRTALCFDAVAGKSTVWLNGTLLGQNVDSFLPFSFDVSNIFHPDRENQLSVYIEPPPTAGDLWLQPCGSWVGWHMRGIWQTVYLETLPPTSIRDVFAQPWVRQERLTVEVEIEPGEAAPASVVQVVILDGDRVVLDLGSKPLDSQNSGQCLLRFEKRWPDAQLWSPDNPHLYHVRAELRDGANVVHRRQVRFGFREFWIDGTGFRLNGQPIRLLGDSWHYMGVAQQNPAYARTWFEFARQVGVNAIRTHAMPYPPCYFDLADEMGMLIIDESAVYGSAGTLAYNEDRFWENCRDHIRRLVRRDRNHPSIIFWSACNETVWKGGDDIHRHLLSLGEEARRLDPTRFVSYDENDCDLGGNAPLHAGHYGTPQHWDRSWQRDRPLVVHEFSSLYHGGPDNVCAFGNEEVYADYNTRLRAAGQDAADMFCRLRELGAASVTPWNLNWYCLEPGPAEPIEGLPESLTEGGAPVQRIGSRSLTLNYGYDPDQAPWKPNPALAPLAECYKRRRFFLERRPRQAFSGSYLEVTPAVWDHTPEPVFIDVTFALRKNGEIANQETWELPPDDCDAIYPTLRVPVPVVSAPAEWTAELTMVRTGSDETFHTESWPIHVHPRPLKKLRHNRTAWMLADTGANTYGCRRLEHGAPLDDILTDANATLVLAGPHHGATLRDWLDRPGVDQWVRTGGRLIALPDAVADDNASVLAPIRQTADHAFPRDVRDGLLRGLSDDHFRDWGADGHVARLLFQRPLTGPAFAPLDVGDPAEGLAYTPLVIVPRGQGHVIVSGLELAERAADTPAASILLQRLINDELTPAPAGDVAVLGDIRPEQQSFYDELGVLKGQGDKVLLCDGSSTAALRDPRLTPENIDRLLSAGGTVLVEHLTPDTLGPWNDRLGTELTLEADVRYNLAKACDSPLMAGLNNFDLYWVNREDKQRIVRFTLQDEAGTARTLVHTVATRWEDYQPAHEQHKAAMMIRRMESFAGHRAAVLEIPRGQGRIIISQLRLADARGAFRERASRIMSRWLDVLGAARDPEVSPLTPRPVTGIRSDGFITKWLVLGPFTCDQGHPLDHDFADEANLHPVEGNSVGQCTWQRVSSAFAHTDLETAFHDAPDNDRVAYAGLYVYAPQDRSVLLDAPDMVTLLLGADGGTKTLLNGQELGRFDFVRELVLDADHVEGVPLKQGWNTLLVKLHNPSGPWRFAARFMTAAGEPTRDLRCQLQAP